jgi:hypothetical protein
MVALALVPRTSQKPSRKSRLAVAASKKFLYPAISLWRKEPITTLVEWCRNGKLYLYRFHPHYDKLGRDCAGRFMLTGEQVEVLLEFWNGVPLQRIVLPQIGKARCEVQHLPDGGLQLLRYDQLGKVATTFRIFAGDVAAFLVFAERGLPRI